MNRNLSPAVAEVLKRLHYPLDVMLLCVRWYVAYPLSLRQLEQMMAERGIAVDHSTVHRWALKLLPDQFHAASTAFQIEAGVRSLRCSRLMSNWSL